jgi:hypothetical protein
MFIFYKLLGIAHLFPFCLKGIVRFKHINDLRFIIGKTVFRSYQFQFQILLLHLESIILKDVLPLRFISTSNLVTKIKICCFNVVFLRHKFQFQILLFHLEFLFKDIFPLPKILIPNLVTANKIYYFQCPFSASSISIPNPVNYLEFIILKEGFLYHLFQFQILLLQLKFVVFNSVSLYHQFQSRNWLVYLIYYFKNCFLLPYISIPNLVTTFTICCFKSDLDEPYILFGKTFV